MTTVHVQVILPALTGLPVDDAINTFTFTFPDVVTPAEVAAATGPELEAFYNDSPGTDPLAAHIARSRVRAANACSMKFFDISAHLNGSPAGPPFEIRNWTLGIYNTSNSFPEEVALALSFHGNLSGLSEFAGGARPKSRHRGRVFIGPLTDNVSDTLTPLYISRPKESFRTDVVAAGIALEAANVGWSVWSRANAATYPVVGGWVDDSWDTIRGRGTAPTFKDTWGTLV